MARDGPDRLSVLLRAKSGHLRLNRTENRQARYVAPYGAAALLVLRTLTAHYVRFPVRHDGSKEPERQEPSQAPSHSNSRQASAPPPPSMSADDADDEIPF